MPDHTPDQAATPEQWRQAFIIRQLGNYCARWQRIAGVGVRYVIEGFVPDATPEEWDWAAAWVREHPEILALPEREQADVNAEERVNAEHYERQAGAAAVAGDYDLAAYLIDAAEWWLPSDSGRWAWRRDLIRRARERKAAVDA